MQAVMRTGKGGGIVEDEQVRCEARILDSNYGPDLGELTEALSAPQDWDRPSHHSSPQAQSLTTCASVMTQMWEWYARVGTRLVHGTERGPRSWARHRRGMAGGYQMYIGQVAPDA